MTEKLLTETQSIKTNKQNQCVCFCFSIVEVNPGEEEAILNHVEGGLVDPDSVIHEYTKIGEAIPVFSSLGGKTDFLAIVYF